MDYDALIAQRAPDVQALADRYQALSGQILGLERLDLEQQEREERRATLESQRSDVRNQLEVASDSVRGLAALRENPPEVTYLGMSPPEPPGPPEPPDRDGASMGIGKPPEPTPSGKTLENVDEI